MLDGGFAGGDGDASWGSLEEEPSAGGAIAEAGEGGVVGAERAAHDDLGEDVGGALAEVPAAFPCIVEELD